MIYLAGSFFIYVFAKQVDKEILNQYWFLTNVFYIIKNIFFAIGILTFRKTNQKSIVPETPPLFKLTAAKCFYCKPLNHFRSFFRYVPGYIGYACTGYRPGYFYHFSPAKVIRYQMQLQQHGAGATESLINASIRLQEEERQRIAADLHDDAGPLLATAGLYLNENLVNQDKATQLQSFSRQGRSLMIPSN